MILIADDDRNILMSLKLLLERAGYEVACASDPAGVMEAVRQGGVDLAIIDMNYSRTTSGVEGLSLLRRLRLHLPDLPVMLITGWGSIELAVEGSAPAPMISSLSRGTTGCFSNAWRRL